MTYRLSVDIIKTLIIDALSPLSGLRMPLHRSRFHCRNDGAKKLEQAKGDEHRRTAAFHLGWIKPLCVKALRFHSLHRCQPCRVCLQRRAWFPCHQFRRLLRRRQFHRLRLE